MRKILFFISVFILLQLALFSEDDPRFCLGMNFMNSPYSYDSVYKSNNTCFDSNLSAGFDFGGFILETEALFDYVSVSGHDTADLLLGAWMNLGGTVNVRFKPLPWLEIKTGLGGLWQKSSLQYNNSGWLGLSQPGITGTLDIRFIPWEFLQIDVKNRLDALIAFDSGGAFTTLLPNYNFGLRATFVPGIKWLGLFIEGDAFLWSYSSAVKDLSNWILKAQVGLAFNFRFDKAESKQLPENKGLNKLQTLTQADVSPQEKTGNKTRAEAQVSDNEELDPALIAFTKLKPGSEVTFTRIVFEEGKVTLTRESLAILDKIADILCKKKSASVLVAAYGQYSGDLFKDSAFIKTRANAIRNYLSAKGVETGRIKVSSSGQIIKLDDKSALRHKVVFSILSD
jgi:outer membrane protein OmpA-like peptidoglycan-associated protein